jgi:hypothetical protein
MPWPDCNKPQDDLEIPRLPYTPDGATEARHRRESGYLHSKSFDNQLGEFRWIHRVGLPSPHSFFGNLPRKWIVAIFHADFAQSQFVGFPKQASLLSCRSSVRQRLSSAGIFELPFRSKPEVLLEDHPLTSPKG